MCRMYKDEDCRGLTGSSAGSRRAGGSGGTGFCRLAAPPCLDVLPRRNGDRRAFTREAARLSDNAQYPASVRRSTKRRCLVRATFLGRALKGYFLPSALVCRCCPRNRFVFSRQEGTSGRCRKCTVGTFLLVKDKNLRRWIRLAQA